MIRALQFILMCFLYNIVICKGMRIRSGGMDTGRGMKPTPELLSPPLEHQTLLHTSFIPSDLLQNILLLLKKLKRICRVYCRPLRRFLSSAWLIRINIRKDFMKKSQNLLKKIPFRLYSILSETCLKGKGLKKILEPNLILCEGLKLSKTVLYTL